MKRHLIMAAASLFFLCLSPGLTAQELFNPLLTKQDSQKHWVCNYIRGQNDVLLLRCDDLAGLLYDRMIFETGSQSKTTMYIPIWHRATNDDAAINLVNILLCKQEIDCRVEMKSVWASRI